MIAARRQDRAPLKREGNPRRRHKEALPAETGSEIWLLTLSDLLLLLLIFFVLLSGLILHRQGEAVATPPPAVNLVVPASAATADPTPPEAVPGLSPTEAAASSLESDLAGVLAGHEGDQVTVERRPHAVVVTFPERIIFDSGLSEMRPSVRPLLEKVSAFILGHPGVAIEIQGHTDDLPIRNARYPSNWELSAHRAAQVAKALIQRGVPPQQLSIRGFGEYRPLHANDGDLNRLKNRRVEIEFSLLPPNLEMPRRRRPTGASLREHRAW